MGIQVSLDDDNSMAVDSSLAVTAFSSYIRPHLQNRTYIETDKNPRRGSVYTTSLERARRIKSFIACASIHEGPFSRSDARRSIIPTFIRFNPGPQATVPTWIGVR
jgi:hypothetical protein